MNPLVQEPAVLPVKFPRAAAQQRHVHPRSNVTWWGRDFWGKSHWSSRVATGGRLSKDRVTRMNTPASSPSLPHPWASPSAPPSSQTCPEAPLPPSPLPPPAQATSHPDPWDSFIQVPDFHPCSLQHMFYAAAKNAVRLKCRSDHVPPLLKTLPGSPSPSKERLQRPGGSGPHHSIITYYSLPGWLYSSLTLLKPPRHSSLPQGLCTGCSHHLFPGLLHSPSLCFNGILSVRPSLTPEHSGVRIHFYWGKIPITKFTTLKWQVSGI